MKRRHLILLIGGASSGTMSVGTGAFSSMEADRGVEVNVVSDDEAYVGYDNPSDGRDAVSVSNGDELELVSVKNRFAEGAEISIGEADVTVEPQAGDTPQIEEVTVPETAFGVGESESITGTIVCDDGGTATVEITVRIEGNGVSAELLGDTETRRFAIECDPAPTVTGVDFQGKGNAALLADGSGLVDVRVYYVADGEVHVTDPESVDVDRKLKTETSLSGETIAGVRVAGAEGAYVHPQFDRSECDVTPDTGSGNSVSGGEVTEASDPTEAFDGCLADDD